jgi:1-acyl-sn-glycerol-3-phosphate acyltransferase
MNIFFRAVKIPLYLFFLLFYRHRIYGMEHLKPGRALIAPNHASFLDPPAIAASIPGEVFILARQSLFKHFFLGFIIRHLNTYPVNGTVQDLSSIKLICRLLEEDKKVLIFPEGLRSEDGTLKTFKAGIGMLALRNHCPVIPVYIHGTFEAWNRYRTLPKLSGKTAVVIGTPIESDRFLALPKKEAQEALAGQVHASIEQLRDWYLRGAHGSPP